MRNLLTDVPGILVGNADDARAATGVTVAVFEHSVVASVATFGGAPKQRPPCWDLALRPVHAPNDGDTMFAAATGGAAAAVDPPTLTELGIVAADCVARSVARGVYEATALPYKTSLPDWKTRFAGAWR